MTSETLVCNQCLALNQVPNEQLIETITCSECNTVLLSNIPFEAETEYFNLLNESTTLPVVVDFWGSWSGGSHGVAEMFHVMAARFRGDANFIRVNCETEQVLANKLAIQSFPTVIIFRNGLEYHRLTGYINELQLHQWLERYLRVKRKKDNRKASQ